MVNRDHADSKKHLWRAFFLLCGGCVLLLSTKLGLSPFWDSALCFGGGGILLYANGEFLFGLLIHANSDTDEAPPAPAEAETAHDSTTQAATVQPIIQSDR